MGMTLLDLMSTETRLRRVASTKGGEYAGPCPWCGGRDRFRVWPYAERPGYWCRGCERSGDAIDFLRQKKGMSFRQSCEYLELVPKREALPTRQGPTPKQPSGAPNQTWQTWGRLFVERAARYLWTSQGREAREYLRGRGLTDETIRAARLGFCPQTFADQPEHWGLTPHDCKQVKIARGIVIAWEAQGHLWSIRIRRLSGEGPRYSTVFGSGNGLYDADTIRYRHPVVLTEGEFDALILKQAIGNMASVVATGSTTGSRTTLWTGLLALASHVLVSYDDDESGNAHARYWLDLLENTRRWRPPWGDVNEIALAGVDIATWIADGLGIEERSAVHAVGEAAVERETVQDTRAASTYEEFMAAAQRIAAVFPGGCTVYQQTPGYTLAEHVKRLCEQQREHERQQWRSRRRVRSS